MTKAIANELAPHNIRVNAVVPGFFIGKQNKHLLIKQEDPLEYTPRGDAILGHIPAKKFGDPAELSGAILLLASNKASGYMTGICIPVDGGYLTASI
jgi:NAD(P)-dependent dehydrogenase (short-subunit alcohol dehydrogenase family)